MVIKHYVNRSGQDLYQLWLETLRDRTAKARISMRINRIAAGAFGDCRHVGSGVWELKIDYGPGYRVYYAQTAKEIILLLFGGDKSTQPIDIKKAISCWQDYQRR